MKRTLTLFLLLTPLLLAQEVPPYPDLTVSTSSNFEPDQASQTTINPAFTSQETIPGDKNDGNIEATNLQIHLIPHTHDDIGWLKTVDQYYYGAWSNVTYAGVQYILDSVTESLSLDLTKRFIYVEMGFFVRWWNEQNLIKKTLVKQLVKNGQLEFINGGWCMNDEAAVYYEDSIDQMTLGHKFLLENFGVIPEIAWHIDPFGHAAAQAALYAQMGFKAFYFARIDWQDKQLRLENKAMEMVWQPNTSQGMENAIFTAVNYYMYEAPPGFCFDIRCSDDPIMDDPRLEMYNLDTEGAAFVEWFKIMSESYLSNNLLHTMGSDFQYQAAAINFKNMDKLIAYINANQNLFNVNVFYSTPSQYINDINKQTNLQFPYKYDDFFPYADVPEGYWTGYFTSRVAVKGYTRQIGRLSQTVKKMVTQAMWANTSPFLSSNWAQVDNSLYVLETAMGTLQHHDAVTGTEQQHVVWDYEYYLGNATYSIMNYILNPYLNEKVAHDLGLSGLTYSICNTNISAYFCNATYQSLNSNMGVLLVVYNPAEARTTTMRAKVPSGKFEITDVSGSQLTDASVVCANSTDTTDCDLFWTDSLNPYNYTYYYLIPSSNNIQAQKQNLNTGTTLTINSQQSITVNSLSQFTLNYNSNNFQFNLNYNFYPSFQATDGEQNSGAYIFRPNNQTENGNIPYATPQNASYWVCPTHLQIQIYYTTVSYAPSFMITNIRIYNDITLGIEVETFVNSININDGQGKEIVLQVTTPNINSGNTWYTDSMGMEMQTRIRNFRPTWNLQVYQNVSGNYYPIQAAMVIQDQTSGKMFGIGTDRAEGGGSIASGQMEIMIHRRLLYDDARGVGEPLNETDWDGQGLRQWVTHKLFLNDTAGGIQTDHRLLQYNDDQPAQVFFAPTSKYPIVNAEELFDEGYMIDYGPYIKTWQRAYNSTTFLFRFQNLDQINNRTVPVTVFQSPAWTTQSLTEMTLNFNQPKSDMILNKLNWNGNQYNNPNFVNNDYLNSSQFLLRPLEIRTFRVVVNA